VSQGRKGNDSAMDEHDQKQSDDPEETKATVLPAREAMSIITQETPAEKSVSSDDQSEQVSKEDPATSTS
jgi:hypothetical protein